MTRFLAFVKCAVDLMSAASRQVYLQAAGTQAVQRGCAATGHVTIIGKQACLRAAEAQQRGGVAANMTLPSKTDFPLPLDATLLWQVRKKK
jgi:hypothetical protein